MPKKIEIYDSSEQVGSGWGSIEDHGSCSTGEVITWHGVVLVYADTGEECDGLTALRFTHEGRRYRRHFIGKRYSHRGIVTLAKQFAKEIYEANQAGGG